MTLDLVAIKEEINKQLADPETLNALGETTFKGLTPAKTKQALLEGMMRGFTFVDFLKKNIYAIPFKEGYSLVTSVDHARKIGMKSGVIGKSAPMFEEKDGKIISCTITIKRKVGEDVGEFSATVYMDEYNTGKNQWFQKPRTMLAKVAEMHALRMACPEEAAQMYVEEEYQQEKIIDVQVSSFDEEREKMEKCTSLAEVSEVWNNLSGGAKVALNNLKNELKKKYAIPAIQ